MKSETVKQCLWFLGFEAAGWVNVHHHLSAPGTVQVLSLHGVSDPGQEVPQSGIDPVLPLGGALLSPADDSGQKPGPSVVHHKRSPTVSTAGIHSGLWVTCTEHVVCNHLEGAGEGGGLLVLV